MQRRHLYLLAASLATAAAMWWASTLEEDEAPSPRRARPVLSQAQPGSPARVIPSNRNPRSAAPTQASLLAELARVDASRSALPELAYDPFAPASFEPPPRKVEPPKPSAPPLRFKYLGRVEEAGQKTVFLDDAGKMLIAREGEALAGPYRVKSIGERSMQIEYTPLQTLQTLNF